MGVTSAGALTVTTQGTGAQQYNSGGSFNVSAQGSVGIGSAANASLNAAADANVIGANQSALVCQTKSIIVSSDALATINGFGAKVQATRLYLERGLALTPADGTFQAPVLATQTAPAGGGFGAQYAYTMSGNKAFITTPAAALVLVVTFPNVPTEINWIATWGGLGNTATNVGAVTQGGGAMVFTGANPNGIISVFVQVT
jgi:hypothetical protein